MNALELYLKKVRTGAAALAKTSVPKKESADTLSLESWLARNRGGAAALVKQDAKSS